MDKEKDVAALRRVRDRLHSTTNEQLGSVLDLLLPKLLPLANDTELQKDVLEVVNECLRRLKNGQQTISLVALFKLVRKELLPLACNLAITFIDVVLDGRVSTITNSVEAANELVESLIVFEPLSFQSNCLCYYAYRTLPMVITVLSNSATLLNSYSNSYSDSISEGNNDRNKSSNSVSAATELGSRVRQRASSILGDYLLDIALLRRAVVTSDAVGSVQPGLSGERVKRLTAKKTSWDLDTVKSVKLLLLDLLPRSTLPPFLSVAISIACLCDSDSVVSAQAVYKVQGAMNLFSVEEKPEETISGLLSLVMNECNSPTNESIKYVTTARTPLSADVLAGVLKWVGKYMQSHLFKSSKVLLGSLYKLLHNSDDSRFTVAVQTNALKVLLELCLHMDNSTIVVTSIIFLKCVKHMLMKAAASAGAVGTNNENRTSLRITCYNIIEQLAIRNADLMVKDIEVVVVLFRFVGSEDETCATRLHAALGALRLAHSASANTQSARDPKLLELIRGSVHAADAKKRLAALQWTRALYQWDLITFDTLLQLADDQSQFVADAVLREFNSLRSKISSAEFMQWDDPRAVVYVETLKNVFITITKQNRSSGENVSTVSSKSMLFLLAVAASGIECYTTKLLGYSLDNVERCSSVDMNAVVAVTEQNCSIEPSILLSALEVIAKVSVNSESSSEIVASTEGVPTALEELSNSHVIGLSAVIVRGALVLLPHAERNKANYLSSILLSWLNHRSNSIRLSASHGLALVSMRSNLDFVSNLNRLLRNKMGFITNIIAEIGKRNIKKQQDAELFTVSGAFLTTALIVKTHLLFLNDVSSVDLATRNEVLRLGDNYLKYLDLVFNSQSDENVATLQQVILAAFETVFLIASYPISVEKVEKESEDNELFLQKLALLLPKMSLFISNSDPAVSSRSIEAVTMLCLRMDNDVAKMTLFEQLLEPTLLRTTEVTQRFAIAEGVARLVAQDVLSESIEQRYSTINRVLIFATGITSNEAARPTLAVLLLVFSSMINFPLRILDLKTILSYQLYLLKDPDLFTQDICCMGICHLYRKSKDIIDSPKQLPDDTSNGDQARTATSYIVREVIATLSRERRFQQPVGMAVAGETSTATNNNNNANVEGTTIGVGINNNGQINTLALAASLAAAELNLSQDQLNSLQQESNAPDRFETDYGVYTLVCKVARKTGDNAIVFGVLGLIKRDPTFNTALSIRDYQQRYQVPTINVHNGKLHSLVPMLYHLRYDPNKVVQGLMRELWLKLFGTEFQALINTFQVEIIKYLLANLVSGSWRDREAAIAAFEDFLPRRSWDVIQPFLIEFLEKGINVLDDVRNSTRLAAVGFSKALSDQIVRSCNPNETAHRTVAATIDTVIPFLMEKGLVASSAEGRGFCLGLLLEIIRTAKKHLKACLSDLISVLLESMSAMEPRTLQYMQFHTARLQISEDELEAMRIKLSQASPMNEALDFCLQSLQSSDIPEVIRKISSHLRRGVGLPTRVAATEAMNLLVERYPNDLGKHASTAFHNILLSLTQSPNMAGSLQKAMYTGLGSLAKVMHGDVLSDESSKLVVTYNSLQHMDLEQSTMLANCLYQLVHRGGDKMNDDAVWLQILSCSYIGSFDLDASTKDTWAKTFSEALSMSGMGTKSYAINKAITIVIGTIKTFLVDTSWLRRSQALLVLKDIIQSVRFSDLEISEVIPMLLYMIRGSVWSGKSLLLETIVEILLQNKDNFVSNSETKILFISGETKDFVASQVMDANANNDSTFILTTDDLLVKKEFQNVMVSVADDDTETSSFAISKTGSEQSKDSIISRLTKKPFWTVNVINLVSVLLRESQKSDKDYRFAAAKALALFPWNYLSSKFTKLLRVFISQFRDMAGAYTNLLQNVQPIENAVITESDRKRRSTASSRPATKQKTAFYFGNRYANATPPIPSTTDKNLIAPPLVGLTTDNSNEMVIANVADSSIVVETSTELEENYQEMVTSVENESKHGNIVDDSINDEAVPVTMKTARVEDPAFRLQFINCIARCWPPIDSMDSDSRVPQEDIVDLIDWTFLVMKHEVWSIRKAALELVGTIAKLETLAETTIGIVISVISLAMQESKYTKVKVEGVKALGNLITGPNKSMIKEQFSNRIRLIIREASTDGQPSILEAVAVVQEAWITV